MRVRVACDVEIVTLKVNGKAYACKNGPVKSRCGSKEFVPDSDAWKCATCGWLITNAMGFHVEAFLPARNDWQTPGGSVFAPEPGGLWTTLYEEYHFHADLAASHANRKTVLYFNEENSALDRDWTLDNLLDIALYNLNDAEDVKIAAGDVPYRLRCFANPPYQPRGAIETWLAKAIEQCAKGVWSGWLIPMSSSVGWFNDYVVPFGQWTTFSGRIAFIDPLATADAERTSPKQDNLFVVFDPDATFSGHVAHRDAKTGRKLWERT